MHYLKKEMMNASPPPCTLQKPFIHAVFCKVEALSVDGKTF